MVTYAILDYNRPVESELCLKSIHKFSKFTYTVVYLSNGGNQDYVVDYYKNGLIDKLVLRNNNSGCGLGTRECFNDFSMESEHIIYVQTDQFLVRKFSLEELSLYLSFLKEKKYFYIDLAGNQGHGNPSERALLMNKYDYQRIPNSIGGPGPFADYKWTEQSLQEYMKLNDLKFFTSELLFMDNGKVSRRQYPCGGELIQFTDEKSVYITRPITKRIDFPNIHFTDKEWEFILNNKWADGTIPELQIKDSFKCWRRPFSVNDVNL
jgi:hypothetical protein